LRNLIYYNLKAFIPKRVLIDIRKAAVRRKRIRYKDIWPIYEKAGAAPLGWTGWPGGKKFALVLTHDVETAKGQEKCLDLMKLEERLGFRSGFYFTPKRYSIEPEVIRQMQPQGFEIGIHGLSHDGRLFQTIDIFRRRALSINHYLKKYQAVGFRSPSMHHNLEWIHQLDIEYDASTTDTDPFEPQSCGMSTIFPFLVTQDSSTHNYVELPYTLPQDFSLFVLMGESNVDIWKAKLDWIAERGGMALLITHPDYMNMGLPPPRFNEYPIEHYEEILNYIKEKYAGQYWHVLPREIARFWRRTAPKMSGKGKWNNIDRNLLCPSCKTILTRDAHKYARSSIRLGSTPAPGKQPSKNRLAKTRDYMRVCMVAYTFYELDNRVKRYAEALARRGDEVDVFALRQPGQSRRQTINGVNVYRIQKRIINEKIKLSYLYRILRFLMGSAVFLAGKHWKNRYDVIHVHSIPDFEVFAAWLPRWMGAKIILDIHDIVPELYASKFNVSENSFFYKSLILLEKASIAFSHHVIIANDLWRQVLTCRSVDEDKCKVFLNYPDQNIFYRRPKTTPNAKFIMMYPGTLNYHQGLDVALRALALIKNQIPNLEFHIYGGGPQQANLVKLTQKLALEDKVFFRDFLPIEQIADTMARADLGVVPKRKDSFGNEAFSTKIFEFMSLGVPVVAADTKIDKYYFNDSVIQFFESGNEHDLARCLLLLRENASLRQRLAKNGLKFIQKNTWDAHQDRYFDLLDELCQNRK